MPDPMTTAIREAQRSLLAQDAKRAALLIAAYGKLWRNVQAQVSDLMRLMEAGEDSTYLRQRAYELAQQVEDEVRRYALYADGQLEIGVVAAIEAAVRDARAVVLAGLGKRASLGYMWNTLQPEVLESALGLLGPGSPLRLRMTQRLGQAVGQAVADKLIQAIAQQINPRQTQRMLRATFGQGLDWSLQATRTATIWAHREATRLTYAANGNIVSGWVWRSARDGRTCLSCIAMDGTVHPLSEKLNDHHNGRCFAQPVLSVGEHPKRETGIEWFNKQDPARQKAMMGPGAFDAWKGGKFDLRDYPRTYVDDVYGQMRRQATLQELLAAVKAA
jgi:hypothetical protein